MKNIENVLLETIGKRLYWDKRISLVDVKVEIGAGRGGVIVTGVVDSRFKKEAALELIRGTEGVHLLEDRLTVQLGLHRSDRTLLSIIEAELTAVPWQAGENVHVSVFAGVVKLTGTVFRKRTKAMAAGFCWELSGVRDCLNHIVLADHPPLVEAQLAHLNDLAYQSPCSRPVLDPEPKPVPINLSAPEPVSFDSYLRAVL